VAVVLLVVGFAAGYGLSSTWGRDLLRREVAAILAELMHGEVEIDEVRLVLSRGLGLWGRGVRVYPSERGHSLRAERAYIELNEPALALGDFELALLAIDGAVLDLSLGEDGRWSFPPLQSALDASAATRSDDPDAPVLRLLADTREIARVLLGEVRVADRIVVRRGAVHLEDHSVTTDAGPGTALQRFQLQQIEGILARRWLSDEGQLAVSAIFVDPEGGESPVRLTSFSEEGSLQVDVAATDLDLRAFSAYVKRLSPRADVAGRISGELRLEASESGTLHGLVDVATERVAPTVVFGGEPARIEIPTQTLSARLEVEPSVVRLVGTRLRGERTAFDFEASVERPIHEDATARLRAEIIGLEVAELGRILDEIPQGEELRQWFRRIESGRVDSVSLGGTTAFSTWRRLVDGELDRLPDGFLLGADVSGVTIGLDEDERIVDASFHADWAADRLEMRRGRGSWRGEALPELNVVVDGLSSFVGMSESPHETNAEPLRGLPLLWDLLLPEDEGSATYRFQVDVDHLDHPILRWPIEDASLRVQQIGNATEALVTKARWGGLPVIAELVYLLEPEPSLTVGIQARPGAGAVVGSDGHVPGGAWGRGRFRLEPGSEADGAPVRPLSRMNGAFTLSEAKVRLSGVEVGVSSNAHVAGDVAVDLRDEDVLPVALQVRIDDADLAEVSPTIGLPEGFLTGRFDANADIVGHLERDRNLFAGLTGTIRGKARKGEIRQKVPVAIKLAAATDGFNPFARQETISYEKIETELLLGDGRITADRLELEGPVRIYATGTVDFAHPPQQIDAVVGVFLMQRIRSLLGMVPLVNLVVPGSDKGMVGAYFRVRGPWEEPDVETMKLKSLKEELPEIITAPVDFIQWLWKGSAASSAPPAAP
jgi:hypothetical protein